VVESFKFITDVFEAIANALGIEVEFKFKFSPPGGNRRRRAAATESQVDIEVIYKTTDQSADVNSLQESVEDTVTSDVNDAIANGDGSVVDQAQTAQVSSSAEVTGPLECSGDENIQDSLTICSGSRQGIAVPICALQELGFEFSELVMGDSGDCVGTRTGANVEFVVDSNSCAVAPEANGTHIIYSAQLSGERGMSNDIINRKQDLKLDWACALEIDYLLSLQSGISTQMAQIEYDLDNVEGTFQVAMGLWTDATYTTPVEGDVSVTVPDKVHIGVLLPDAAEQYKLQLKKCWATPSADANDALNYPFIEDFCGDDKELNEYETLEIYSNGDSQNARFAIESFAFTADTAGAIYFHCNVRVCDSGLETCTPTCGARRKRSADEDDHVISIKVNYTQ